MLFSRAHVDLYDSNSPIILFFAHRVCQILRCHCSLLLLRASQAHGSQTYISQFSALLTLGLTGFFSSIYGGFSSEQYWFALRVPWGVSDDVLVLCSRNVIHCHLQVAREWKRPLPPCTYSFRPHRRYESSPNVLLVTTHWVWPSLRLNNDLIFLNN